MNLNVARQRMPRSTSFSLRSRLPRIGTASVPHTNSQETLSLVRRVVLSWHSYKITEPVRVLDAKPLEEDQMILEELEVSWPAYVANPSLRSAVRVELYSSCSHKPDHVIQCTAVADQSCQISTQAVGKIMDAVFHSLAPRKHRERALSEKSIERARAQDPYWLTWDYSGIDQRKQGIKPCGQCCDLVQQQPTDNAGILFSKPDRISVLKPRNLGSALGSPPSEHCNYHSYQADRSTDDSRPVNDTRATQYLTLQDAIAPRHVIFLARYAGINLSMAIFSRAGQMQEACSIASEARDAA